MAVINLGSIFRCTVWNQMQAQAGLVVLHYKAVTQAGTGGTQEAIANAVHTQLGITMAACQSDLAVCQGVIVSSVYDPLSQLLGPYFSTTLANQGALAGDPLPKQVSGIITKRTGNPGSKGRGRCYIPFPTEGVNDATGVPTAAYTTLLSNLAAALQQNLLIGLAPNTTTLSPCVFRRSNPASSFLVLSHQQRNRWATQRRRGDYGKSNVSPF